MGRPFTPQATSLCITSRPEFSDARPNLMRVADVADGRLVKASVNSEQEWIFENRDAFFYKDITSEQSKIGYLGFYRWSTTEQMENPMKDYVQVSPVCGQTPTEVISMSHLEDQRQLVKKLLAGVAITPTAETRHILFTIEESKYSCVGLLVEKGSLKQQADGLFALSKQVSILKQYVILTRNILTIPVPMAGKLQECGVPKTLRLCERLDLGEADEIINVKSPVEIVRDIVLQKASWGRYSQLIDGGTHAQHDALKAFIAQVGEDTLMEEIAKRTGASTTAAEAYLYEFLGKASQLLESGAIEKRTIEQIVQNTESLRADCVEAGRAIWEKENTDIVSDAKRTLDAARNESEKKRRELDDMDKRIASAKAELQKLDKNIQNNQAIISGIESSVRKQMAASGAELNRFYAQRALSGSGANAAILRPGHEAGYQEEDGWTAVAACIQRGLEGAGMSARTTVRAGLAAALAAAAARKDTVLLSGLAASEIVKIVSIAVCGRTQDILECNGAWDPTMWEVAMERDTPVIEVRGAFDYNNGSDSTALSRMLFDCLQRKKACFITTPDVALLREVYTDQMADNMLALDCGGVFRTILVQNEYATAFKGETLEIPEAISPLHMKVAGPYSAIIREAAVRLTGRGDCSLDGLLFSNGTGKRGTVDGDESELNGLTLSPGTGTFPLPPPKTTSKDNTGL